MLFLANLLTSTDNNNIPRVRSRSEDRRERPGGGGGSSSSGEPTTTAGSLSAADCLPEANPIIRQRRDHKTPAHSLAFRAVYRTLVTTSGELILLTVWDRRPKPTIGQRPLARYSNSDILLLFLRIFPEFRTLRVQNGG